MSGCDWSISNICIPFQSPSNSSFRICPSVWWGHSQLRSPERFPTTYCINSNSKKQHSRLHSLQLPYSHHLHTSHTHTPLVSHHSDFTSCSSISLGCRLTCGSPIPGFCPPARIAVSRPMLSTTVASGHTWPLSVRQLIQMELKV